MKKANSKQLTVIKDAPKGPSFRPNNPAQKEPINGKKINNRYIKNFEAINFKILKTKQKELTKNIKNNFKQTYVILK
jgi:hypothetical protein